MARLTRRARLVYADSRITALINRSGGVDAAAAAGSFGGAVIPQSIYDLRPLTPSPLPLHGVTRAVNPLDNVIKHGEVL